MERPKKPKKKPSVCARDAAFKALARREHSARELQFKLGQRGYEEADVVQVLSDLQADGWQSDQRYADMLARTRSAQGYGPLRIRAEAHSAGIDESEINRAIAALEEDFDALAQRVHAKRFGQTAANPKDWQKQYRYLAGRGFDSEQIRQALKSGPPEE